MVNPYKTYYFLTLGLLLIQNIFKSSYDFFYFRLIMGNSSNKKKSLKKSSSISPITFTNETSFSTHERGLDDKPQENTVGSENLNKKELNFNSSRSNLVQCNTNKITQDNFNNIAEDNIVQENVTNIVQGNVNNITQDNATNIAQGNVNNLVQDNNVKENDTNIAQGNVNNLVQDNNVKENASNIAQGNVNNIEQQNMNIKPLDPENNLKYTLVTTKHLDNLSNVLDYKLLQDNLNKSSKTLDVEKFPSNIKHDVDAITNYPENLLKECHQNITLPNKEKEEIPSMIFDNKFENDIKDSLDLILEKFWTLDEEPKKNESLILIEKTLNDKKKKENALKVESYSSKQLIPVEKIILSTYQVNPQKKNNLKHKKKNSETLQISTNQNNINPLKKDILKNEKNNISYTLISDDEISNLILKHIEDVDRHLQKYSSQKPKLSCEMKKQITSLNEKIDKALKCHKAIEPDTNVSDQIGKTSPGGGQYASFEVINKNAETNEKLTKRTYDSNVIKNIWKKNKSYFPYLMFFNKSWLCYLCEAHLGKESVAIEHICGKKHYQKVEKTFENIEEELKKGIVGQFPYISKRENFFCIPCKQNIICKPDLLLHIILKSHRVNLIQHSLNTLNKSDCIEICKKHEFIIKTPSGEYYCTFCDKLFSKEQQIFKHIISSDHKTELWQDISSEYLCVINEFDSYRCVPCDLSFIYIEQIRDHFQIDHKRHINFFKKHFPYSKEQSNNEMIKKSQGAIPKVKNQEKEGKNINNLQNSQDIGKLKKLIEWNKMHTINNLEFSFSKSTTYYCVPCDMGPMEKFVWDQHSKGKLHTKKVQNLQLNVQEYVCQFCKNIVYTYLLGMKYHYQDVHNTRMILEKNNLIASYFA